MPRLRDRSLNELLVLLVTGTVCFSVLASGAALFIIVLIHPERDFSAAVGALAGLIGSLISVLAGFMAGHSTAKLGQSENGSGDQGGKGT